MLGRRARPDLTAREDRFVQVAGVRLRVVVAGVGPPLLMINGIGGHVAMWEPLTAELVRTRQVVMFDAPGCGKSSSLMTPMRMPGLARLVTRLLDALELEQVDVLGYSWGGAVAQQLARDHGDRVKRLVLASTTPGLGGALPSMRVLTLMSSPLRFQSARMTTEMAADLYGGGGSFEHVLMPWNEHPPSTLAYASQMFAISGWSSMAWLHRLAQPTLVLSGTADPLVPVANARILAERIPNAELHLVEGAGHLWLLGRAQASATVIDRFLSS